MPRKSNPDIREFILRNLDSHPTDIGAATAKKFGVSRETVGNYLAKLADENLVSGEGRTKARTYRLTRLVENDFELEIGPGFFEDAIWRYRILPQIKDVKKNIVDICQYGFTEMLNNVLDHSESKKVLLSYRQTYAEIRMAVADYGVGIFEKIRRDFNLEDARSALLELSKGKLTSDSAHHSGEGIFFTSRMFDKFRIHSGHLFYRRENRESDDDAGWLIETEEKPEFDVGTVVDMVISTASPRTMSEVYDKYQNDNARFRTTHVPVKLAQYPGEQLVSRSQAKRLLARFEKFSEVLLDFEGVPEIGQGFADEIFRVYANSHPEIHIATIGASDPIKRMIAQVRAAND